MKHLHAAFHTPFAKRGADDDDDDDEDDDVDDDDGVSSSSSPKSNDTSPMSTVLPTMWMGSQAGFLFVHSSMSL